MLQTAGQPEEPHCRSRYSGDLGGSAPGSCAPKGLLSSRWLHPSPFVLLIDGRRRGAAGNLAPNAGAWRSPRWEELPLHRHALLRCAANYAGCRMHTCAPAFPWLQQLLCQSGELIMGKQICLASPPPHPPHTHIHSHTRTDIHRALLPVSPASVSSITQEPGAASRLPGATQNQRPRGKRCSGWMPSWLSSRCPRAPAFTPAASPQPHQSTYDNSQMPPNRKHIQLQSADQKRGGGGRGSPTERKHT